MADVEQLRRLLEEEVIQRADSGIGARVQCYPPVARIQESIVVRVDLLVPVTVETTLRPILRCSEVETFRKPMHKKRQPQKVDRVWFEATFRGKDLGPGAFHLPVFPSASAIDPLGVGNIQLFKDSEVAMARNEVAKVLRAGRTKTELPQTRRRTRKRARTADARPPRRRRPR
jgi:hypothetical protein